MTDSHFRKYAEIFMEEMISMLEEKDDEIKKNQETIDRMRDLATNLLRNAKVD